MAEGDVIKCITPSGQPRYGRLVGTLPCIIKSLMVVTRNFRSDENYGNRSPCLHKDPYVNQQFVHQENYHIALIFGTCTVCNFI